MITGAVNARHEIVIRLPVRNSAGQEQEVETILDTGFNATRVAVTLQRSATVKTVSGE